MSIRIKQNGQWVPINDGTRIDSSLTKQGEAADAYVTGTELREMTKRISEVQVDLEDYGKIIGKLQEYNSSLPIKTSEDGFTDIFNTPVPVDISIKEITGYIDGSSELEVLMNLQGNRQLKSHISFDEEGKPTQLTTKEIYCPITWTTEEVQAPGEGVSIVTGGVINSDIKTRTNAVRPVGTNYLRFRGGEQSADGNLWTSYLEFVDYFDFSTYSKIVFDIKQVLGSSSVKLYFYPESNPENPIEIDVPELKSGENQVEKDISELAVAKTEDGAFERYKLKIESTTTSESGEVSIINIYLVKAEAQDLMLLSLGSFNTEVFGKYKREDSGNADQVGKSGDYLRFRWSYGRNGNDGTGMTNAVIATIPVDLTEYDLMKVDGVLSSGVDYAQIEFWKPGSSKFEKKSIAKAKTIDVSNITGERIIKIRARLNVYGTSYYKVQNITFIKSVPQEAEE